MAQHKYPILWRQNSRIEVSVEKEGTIIDETCNFTFQQLQEKFSSKPAAEPWIEILKKSLVVGEEYVLVCYYFSRHRIAQKIEEGGFLESSLSQMISIFALSIPIFLILWFSRRTPLWSGRYYKIQTRLIDMILTGALLRLLAAALKTLTASYSSDTVYTLSFVGMIVHLWGCDYSYANGMTKGLPPTTTTSSPPQQESKFSKPSLRRKREPFLGGTMSLNAAFFSTTLLVSRLNSNWVVHIFVSTSITLFAFYPPRRHQLYLTSPQIAPYGKSKFIHKIWVTMEFFVYLKNLNAGQIRL